MEALEEFIVPISWAVVFLLIFVGDRLPGGLYFWTGVVVIVVGFSALASPNSVWPFQMGFIILYVIGKRLLKAKLRAAMGGNESTYDTRGSGKGKHVGKVATVSKAIRGGFGMVMIKNDPWQVRSDEDIPAGSKVQVVGTDGEYLTVARAQ